MKTKFVHVGIILTLTTLVSFAPSALAVEGGMQRPISGMQIAPFAGVIPPEPGFDVVVSEIYYFRLYRRRGKCSDRRSFRREC
jgi:hypothetical protein